MCTTYTESVVQTNKKKGKKNFFFYETSVILYRSNEFHVYKEDEQQNATSCVTVSICPVEFKYSGSKSTCL